MSKISTYGAQIGGKHERVILTLVAPITNGAAPTQIADLPKELKLLNSGKNSTVKGDVVVSQATRQLLPLNQARRGFDRVALDFEHNTVPGTPAFESSAEPRPVAAFGTPELRADGLWLSNIVWTDDGQKNARNFCDLSPAPELNAQNEVVFLNSVALCRQGAVHGLSFYSVQMPAGDHDASQENSNMEDTLVEKIIALLKKGLGLAETATEEEVVKAIEGLMTMSASIAKLDTKLTTLSAAPGDTATAVKLQQMEGRMVAFEATLAKQERDGILSLAASQGKVIPLTAEQISATPIATLSAMVEKLPVTVPLSARTPGHVPPTPSDATTMTEMDKKVAAACGFSEEDVKKANKLNG